MMILSRYSTIAWTNQKSAFELASTQRNFDALRNILRHAKATGLKIRQSYRDKALYLPACNEDVELLQFLVNDARPDVSALVSESLFKP
jgi:hypothetical protein